MSSSIDRQLQELGHARSIRMSLVHFCTFPFVLEAGDLLANMPRTGAIHYADRFGLDIAELPFSSPGIHGLRGLG